MEILMGSWYAVTPGRIYVIKSTAICDDDLYMQGVETFTVFHQPEQ